ncbi:MAG: hypothetical protein AB1611_10295 [bacterium]
MAILIPLGAMPYCERVNIKLFIQESGVRNQKSELGYHLLMDFKDVHAATFLAHGSMQQPLLRKPGLTE